MPWNKTAKTIATAAGKSTGVIVTTVPNEVPVAMPKIALAT